ncbi:MAG: extracellular solute-binding protein [Anaerolineaceae bacterium]
MKKIIFTHFALMITVALTFTGCAPGQLTPTQPVETSAPTRAATQALPTVTPAVIDNGFGVDPTELTGLQIQFIHPWTGTVLEELVLMVDEFNQGNDWGIHVIMSAPGSAAMVTSKTWEGIANQQPPNVLVASPSFILAVDKKEELVVDLTPYVSSHGYGLSSQAIDDFSPLFWRELMVERKRIGIPAQQSALLLAYNQTWAQELGFINAPVNDTDFLTQMCAANASFLKDADTTNDGLGGWLISTDPVATLSWLYAFGVEPKVNDAYQFSGAAGESALEFLLDLRSDSCAWVGRTTQDGAYFANRQALAVTTWLQDLPALERELERVGSQDEWTVIPFPGRAGQVVTTAGSAYAVLKNTPAKDLAAWLFIRWLSQPAQQARLLNHFGTLPLNGQAEAMLGDEAQTLQLKAVLGYADLFRLQPVDADWMIISPVLEDAGWQLLRAGIKADQIPLLLNDLDAIILELAERHP